MRSNLTNAKFNLNLPIEEQNKIRKYANLKGKSVEEFVIESINNQILLESDQEYTSMLSKKTHLILENLWDNEKDAAYDNLSLSSNLEILLERQ